MYITVADVFRPKAKNSALMYNIGLVLAGTILLWLSSKARVDLTMFGNPVPITGQSLVVLLLGMLYGSKLGGATLLAYLAEGAIGLPVFTNGGGFHYFFTPTAGYLIGFLVAAYVVGKLAEAGWDRKFSTTVGAMLIGNVIIYVLGAIGAAYLINALGGLLSLSSLSLTAVTDGQVLGSIERVSGTVSKAYSAESLWIYFVQPFIIGDVLKTIAAAALLPLGWKLLGKNK